MTDAPFPAAEMPGWYSEVPPAERGDAGGAEVGACRLFLCNRGDERLIISFAATDEVDHAELDWPDMIDRLARKKGWSHLAIYAPPDSWFCEPALVARLGSLRDDGVFARFGSVTLIGASEAGGGHAALAFAPLCPGAVVVAFSPQSTLDPAQAPWDARLSDIRDGSTGPDTDVAGAMGDVSRAYVVFDPFDATDRRHVERLWQERVVRLHGFGLGQFGAMALRRLGQFDAFVAAAVEGRLTPPDFQRMVRERKNLYLYRRAMEAALEARGRVGLLAAFTAAFRRRSRSRRTKKQRQKPADAPGTQAAPTPRAHCSGRRHPRTLGNVWMLEDDGQRFRYLSDQCQGRVMGFEERGGVTLAQTPALALGIVAFGDGVGVPRPVAGRLDWHVVDETLDGRGPAFTARSQATIRQHLGEESGLALRTIVALSEPQAGITATEALPGSVGYRAVVSRIGAARAALAAWEKDFFLERITLCLLAAAPDTPYQEAIDHYGAVAHALCRDAAEAAGQASFPAIVVSQGAGSRSDGRSEVILAEGQLDIAHPASGIIVATPKYPFALMPQMPATHDPAALLLIDELETLAVAEVMAGRRWHCPALIEAWVEGRTILARFSAMGDLVLDPGVHGFAIRGGSNTPTVSGVEVKGRTVRITLDAAPEGAEPFLTYAWGAVAEGAADDMPANRGALREAWARPSRAIPGRQLYRHALSGWVRLTRKGGAAGGGGIAP